ncbi:hypothetical protein [Klebsiella michiganensis]|uniref:hypothetical protein n=1 Tax=Klebsiella michiganensis TaxID=1134687 RepID=UPI0023AA9869|nr:hypothetical protein [Klebsiella michiganensis]EKU5181755.1 hypothetical protein [Klebsiella oxytoca]ELT9694276.1 hypothetical protein [Klebsiella oxytoca]WEF08780.1 hypothetical protein M8333_10870 [Klebsiella michiganensis]
MSTNYPFITAAEIVLKMYELRQNVAANKVNPHSVSEIEWCCHQLNALANAAAYSGHDKESNVLEVAASFWKETGCKPAFEFE